MDGSLVKPPMEYLVQATGTLRDLRITPARPDFAPINAQADCWTIKGLVIL